MNKPKFTGCTSVRDLMLGVMLLTFKDDKIFPSFYVIYSMCVA